MHVITARAPAAPTCAPAAAQKITIPGLSRTVSPSLAGLLWQNMQRLTAIARHLGIWSGAPVRQQEAVVEQRCAAADSVQPLRVGVIGGGRKGTQWARPRLRGAPRVRGRGHRRRGPREPRALRRAVRTAGERGVRRLRGHARGSAARHRRADPAGAASRGSCKPWTRSPYSRSSERCSVDATVHVLHL